MNMKTLLLCAAALAAAAYASTQFSGPINPTANRLSAGDARVVFKGGSTGARFVSSN